MESFLWVFQDKASRNTYFPEKDFPTEKFEKIRSTVDWLYADSTFFKHFQFGWNTSGFSTDYEVFAISDSISREWLQDDAVVVFKHFKMKPDQDSLAFEQFLVNEWVPAKSNAIDGTQTAFLKVTRGYREGQYALLYVFENVLVRNEVLPYEGTGQNAEPDPIDQKLSTFVDDSDQEEAHYEIVF